MSKLYQRSEDKTIVFKNLNIKFAQNLQLSLKESESKIATVELKARTFPKVGEILSKTPDITSTQTEIICIFHEIFGDIICSVYFAGCALDK